MINRFTLLTLSLILSYAPYALSAQEHRSLTEIPQPLAYKRTPRGHVHNATTPLVPDLLVDLPEQSPSSQSSPSPPTEKSSSSTREGAYKKPDCGPTAEGYTINFEDISVIQLIQFISKISGTNYIFDSRDLQFNITIVSEDQTSVADLSAALLQILKMHNLSVVEQGNNVLIYKNQSMSKISTVITNENINDACDTAIITRVFSLLHVDPVKTAAILKTLVSPEANVEPSVETGHLIVTDITANVNKIADLLSALDSKPSVDVDVREYIVKRADPALLVEYAKEILSPLAGQTLFSLTPANSSNKIFIVAVPFMIGKTLEILESLDVADITPLNPVAPSELLENNQFYMYKLKYQSGHAIAEALREIGTSLQYTGIANMEFVNTIYSVQWLEVNNSIIITGSQDSIRKVIGLLDDLDRQPKQVYIEVLVIDTLLQNSLDFGVQWIALGEEQNKLAFGSGLLSNSPAASLVSGATAVASSVPPLVPIPGTNINLPTPGNLSGTSLVGNVVSQTAAFGLGIVGNIISHNGQSFLTLGALLSALDEEAHTTIVLNPKIMVEDTQPANFFVGQNIPYQTTSTVIQQTGSVTQNIQYEDIGVQLQVIPTISPDNIVTLQINQTVATLASGIGNLTPTTNKELVSTRVHVPDGAFLVMSGHIFDQCDYIRSGIPCLGSMPLIGPMFSRTIEARQKRNLIFFIRPKVVSTIQDGICLTNQAGYSHNWESDPCSLRAVPPERAPECEIYPAPPLCPYSIQPPAQNNSNTWYHRDKDSYNDNVDTDNHGSEKGSETPFGRPKEAESSKPPRQASAIPYYPSMPTPPPDNFYPYPFQAYPSYPPSPAYQPAYPGYPPQLPPTGPEFP